MFCTSQNSKCQDLPKFQFSLGVGGVLYQIPEQGVLANLRTNFVLPLSGSLCITDSLSHTPTATRGGGEFCSSQKSKCQDLPKFQFSGGRGEGVFCSRQKSKCQDLP